MTASSRCLGCDYRMTWAARRRQYGRLLRRGFSADQAKAAMPRCQKCVTRWLHEGLAPGGVASSEKDG